MYDEMPRTSWIFKYSAQNTVVVSRTFFTQEVNEAFDELEEGNEDALKTEYERQVSLRLPSILLPVHDHELQTHVLSPDSQHSQELAVCTLSSCTCSLLGDSACV